MALSAASNAVRAVEQAAIKITSMLRCLRRLDLGIAHSPLLDERFVSRNMRPGAKRQARGSSSSATSPATPSFSTTTYAAWWAITCSISMSSCPSASRK